MPAPSMRSAGSQDAHYTARSFVRWAGLKTPARRDGEPQSVSVGEAA